MLAAAFLYPVRCYSSRGLPGKLRWMNLSACPHIQQRTNIRALGATRHFARISSRPPKVQIPAHIALFMVVFVPTVGLSTLYVFWYGPSEEELEADIRKKYQQSIRDRGIVEKNAQVGTYFGQVFNGESGPPPEVQAQLDALLAGGRNKHGRQQQFDELSARQLVLADEQKARNLEALRKIDEDDATTLEPTKRKRRKRKKKKKSPGSDVDTAEAKAQNVNVVSRSRQLAIGATALAATAVVMIGVMGGGAK